MSSEFSLMSSAILKYNESIGRRLRKDGTPEEDTDPILDLARDEGLLAEPIPEPVPPQSAFSSQVGGSHYKSYVIQPYEFFYVNQISHHKAAIIRRILRYDHPTGKGMEDLNKIVHEIQLIKELMSKENPDE